MIKPPNSASLLSQFGIYTCPERRQVTEIALPPSDSCLKGLFNINAVCNYLWVPAKSAGRTQAMNVPVCLKIILIYRTWLKLLFVDLNLRADSAKGGGHLQKYANIHQNEALGWSVRDHVTQGQPFHSQTGQGAAGDCRWLRRELSWPRGKGGLLPPQPPWSPAHSFALVLVPGLLNFSPNRYHSIKLQHSAFFALPSPSRSYPGDLIFPPKSYFPKLRAIYSKINDASSFVF